MQPDVVRQVGCSHGRVALAIHAVARRTGGELAFAEACTHRVVGAAGKAQYIVGEVFDVVGRSHCFGQGGHHAGAAECDGFTDLLGCSAVDPVAVGQVGEAFAAACIRAVALGAVVHVQAFTHCHGLCVARHLFGRQCGEACIDRLQVPFGIGRFRAVFTLLRPVEFAGKGAKTGVGDQVGERENACDDEQPHPPAGKWVVHLTQVFVPDVAGGVVARVLDLGAACNKQKPQAAQNAEHGRDGHKQ